MGGLVTSSPEHRVRPLWVHDGELGELAVRIWFAAAAAQAAMRCWSSACTWAWLSVAPLPGRRPGRRVPQA